MPRGVYDRKKPGRKKVKAASRVTRRPAVKSSDNELLVDMLTTCYQMIARVVIELRKRGEQ